MKDVFTPDQMADLMAINEICAELEAALVLIGAMSLIVSMDDIGRFTRDVDLTVALDLDEFGLLTDRLRAAGWTRVPRLEHRWIAPRKTIVDLLPAGPKLRSAGSIEWPLSQFAMSLAGFDHVFANAVDLPLTNGAHIRVAPPIITVLLKMIAYTEDPHRRAKDLADIRRVLERYEADSDRLFSDAVFDAELPDFSEANAFLLGVDLRALATQDEAAYIERFLGRRAYSALPSWLTRPNEPNNGIRSFPRALKQRYDSHMNRSNAAGQDDRALAASRSVGIG